MNLPNPKELKVLLKLCRSQGVNKITIGDMSVEFGDMPYEIKGGERVPVSDETLPGQPTEEDLLYWSSQPDPLAARTESQ